MTTTQETKAKRTLTPTSSHRYLGIAHLVRNISGPDHGSADPPHGVSLPTVHGLFDQLVGMISGPCQELCVVAEENLDALPGPARAFGRVHAGRQPEGDSGMAQVLGSFRQTQRVLVQGESCLSGPSPGNAVGRVVDVVPCLVLEDPTIGGDTEPGDVVEEHPHKNRWDGNRLGSAAFQLVDFMYCPVVRPLLSRSHNSTFEVEQPPARRGKSTLGLLEVNHLRRPHAGVVHAAEEGVRVRPASGQQPYSFQKSRHLDGVGHAIGVDFVVHLWSGPPQADERVVG